MTDDVKRRALIFLALAAILIITIAAALPQFELNPGTPLPGRQDVTGALPADPAPLFSISINTFVRAMLLIVLAAGAAYCGYIMLRGASLKDLLRPILATAAIGAAASLIIFILFAMFRVPVTLGPDETNPLPPATELEGPPLGALPQVFIWLAWTALCLAIVILGYRLILRQTQGRRIGDPLTLEAEEAARALRMGGDLKDVIISCYRQMSLVLQKEQGIDLKETMTAREFERLLEARGVPHAPVHQLTQLFEAARYGCQAATLDDEREALDCLNAIVLYTREAGGER